MSKGCGPPGDGFGRPRGTHPPPRRFKVHFNSYEIGPIISANTARNEAVHTSNNLGNTIMSFDGLSDISNQDLLAEVRSRYLPNPQAPFPLEMFELLNECRPAAIAEVVALRDMHDRVEVLLAERESTDVGYVNMSNVPGGYLYIGEPIAGCISRVMQREVGAPVSFYKYAGVVFNTYEERGHHVHHVFVAELADQPVSARWYDVTELPKNLVAHHGPIIQMALAVHRGTQPAGQYVEYQPGQNESSL